MNLADLNLDVESVHIYYVDNTHALVASLNNEYMRDIRYCYTIQKKNYKFMPSYKSGNWDGNIRFIKPNGLIPRGLVSDCIRKLKELNIPVRVDKRLRDEDPDISDVRDVVQVMLNRQHDLLAQGKIKKILVPHDYQWDVVETVLKKKKCIARAATSSGKTFMTAMTVHYLLATRKANKVLIIVPLIDLVVQMYTDFQEYGIPVEDCGMFMGKTKDAEKPITIATWQTLQHIEDRSFFEQFDALIADECHKLNAGDVGTKEKRSVGTVIKQISEKCTAANYKIGVTGTMPDEEVDCKAIIGALGPVEIEVTTASLMEQGHVSKLEIIIPFISYGKESLQKIREITAEMESELRETATTVKYQAEKKFIETYIPRIKYICKIVNSKVAKKQNTLILVDTIEAGKKFKKAMDVLVKDAVSIEHIYGEIEIDERVKVRQIMENNTGCVIIATASLFSTGISIKNLHNVIFATSTKSKIRTLQSIGRSLRLHESKDVATVIDIVDNLKYSSQHAKERINFYTNEQFDIRIIEVAL